MHFGDRLMEAIKKKNSVICVGLDPRLDQIPAFIIDKAVAKHDRTFKGAAAAFLEFNKGIIDAVSDLVPVVKPQIAFYEQYGSEGIRAFEETCEYAQEKGLLVIADAKRNDIGSTADAYAKAFLGEVDLFGKETIALGADSLTVNAYLGLDGIKPFLKACHDFDAGIFVLVKTSNPSSGDIQDRVTADEEISIAELMANFVDSWGFDLLGESGYSSVGAVVGATYPKELQKLRKLMPATPLLVPGYGAQGGGAEDVAAAFDKDGLGAVVNSSRGIIFAYEQANSGAVGPIAKKGENYAEAARDAVIKMNEDLNGVR